MGGVLTCIARYHGGARPYFDPLSSLLADEQPLLPNDMILWTSTISACQLYVFVSWIQIALLKEEEGEAVAVLGWSLEQSLEFQSLSSSTSWKAALMRWREEKRKKSLREKK